MACRTLGRKLPAKIDDTRLIGMQLKAKLRDCLQSFTRPLMRLYRKMSLNLPVEGLLRQGWAKISDQHASQERAHPADVRCAELGRGAEQEIKTAQRVTCVYWPETSL